MESFYFKDGRRWPFSALPEGRSQTVIIIIIILRHGFGFIATHCVWKWQLDPLKTQLRGGEFSWGDRTLSAPTILTIVSLSQWNDWRKEFVWLKKEELTIRKLFFKNEDLAAALALVFVQIFLFLFLFLGLCCISKNNKKKLFAPLQCVFCITQSHECWFHLNGPVSERSHKRTNTWAAGRQHSSLIWFHRSPQTDFGHVQFLKHPQRLNS